MAEELTPEKQEKIDSIPEASKHEPLEISPESDDKVEQEKLAMMIDQRIQQEQKHGLGMSHLPNLHTLIVLWLVVVVAFVFMSGCEGPGLNNPDCHVYGCFRFHLPENVLIAFIVSTTASVIGLYRIAVKWLYPSSDEKLDSDK